MDEIFPVLDRNVLSNLEEALGKEDMDELLESYREDFIARMVRIGAFIDEGPLDAVAKDAHDIGSTSGSYGFRKFEQLARQVEAAGIGEQRSRVLSLWPGFLTAAKETEAELNSRLGTRNAEALPD